MSDMRIRKFDELSPEEAEMLERDVAAVSYTHLTLPTTPYV